jgi:hypothetical protein
MAAGLRDHTARETNFLNLKNWKEIPTQACLLGLPGYHILTPL